MPAADGPVRTPGRRGLRVGLLIDTDVADPGAADAPDAASFSRHVLDLGREAETAGFDGVFLPDRHMRATTLAPNQFVNAAALAAATTTVDVGSYCSVLPLYHPMHFAESWAAIDQLSGGRAVVAVGAGYSAAYLRSFGVERAGYRQRFVEAEEIVRQAWTATSPWTYDGEIFRLEDVELLPGPVRPEGPPLWIAGQGPWAVGHASRRGDGFAGDPFPITVESWTERTDRIRAGAAERGAPDPEIVLLRHVYLTDSDAEAAAVLDEVCLPQFRFYEDAGLLADRLPPGVSVDASVVADAAVAGSAEYCARRLAAFVADYGVTYLIVKILRSRTLSPSAERAMVGELGRKVLQEVLASCSTS